MVTRWIEKDGRGRGGQDTTDKKKERIRMAGAGIVSGTKKRGGGGRKADLIGKKKQACTSRKKNGGGREAEKDRGCQPSPMKEKNFET